MASLSMGWDWYRLNITHSPCLPHCISLDHPQRQLWHQILFSQIPVDTYSINHLSVWTVCIGAGFWGLAVHTLCSFSRWFSSYSWICTTLPCMCIAFFMCPQADPSGRMVWGVGLRPFTCWDCGSNPARGMDVCLLWTLCVTRYRSLCQTDHSSTGIQPCVVCPRSAIMKGRPLPGIVSKSHTKK